MELRRSAAGRSERGEAQWTLAENILNDAFQGLIVGDEDDLGKYSERLKQIPEFVTYTVKKGDTVDSLADEFNTEPDIIAEANRMTTGTSIGPGQILLVPRQ